MSPGGELCGRLHGVPQFAVRARIERFDPVQRRRRALRLAAPLVLISLAVLPLPGLHLSIPFLLGAALWFGGRRLRQSEQIRELVGECPCGRGPQTYPLPDRIGLPLTLRCPTCREFVRVERAEPGSDEASGEAGSGRSRA